MIVSGPGWWTQASRFLGIHNKPLVLSLDIWLFVHVHIIRQTSASIPTTLLDLGYPGGQQGFGKVMSPFHCEEDNDLPPNIPFEISCRARPKPFHAFF